MSVFGEYGKFYDLLNKDKDYRQEVSYIRHLIDRYHPSGKSVLELGCGTGIHAQLLQQRGLHVTGIDSSEEMLKVARTRLNGSDLRFLHGDILDFKNEHCYDVAISLFHVMSYMNETGKLKMAFENAEKHLHPHGIFIFDCWHGDAVLAQPPHSREKKHEDDHVAVRRVSHPEWIKEKNLVHVHFDIEITDKILKEVRKISETHSMRYWFKNEIEEALNNSGFELLRDEEWLSGKDLSGETWNACYIARKIN